MKTCISENIDLFKKTVSRETIFRIEKYLNLLNQWNSKINLISKNDLTEIWTRHIIDSLQLINYLPSEEIIDLGSGAGFPGMMLAYLDKHVTLIESDRKKAIFLTQAAKFSAKPVQILNIRIEELKIYQPVTVTARALAKLTKLLSLIDLTILKPKACIFLKGKSLFDELEEAERFWQINYQIIPSITAVDAFILKINNFQKRG